LNVVPAAMTASTPTGTSQRAALDDVEVGVTRPVSPEISQRRMRDPGEARRIAARFEELAALRHPLVPLPTTPTTTMCPGRGNEARLRPGRVIVCTLSRSVGARVRHEFNAHRVSPHDCRVASCRLLVEINMASVCR
jgi:hypothetical protein